MTFIHEDLRPILSSTYGILLYQEQSLSIFRLANFPDEEVDIARRCLYEDTLITMGNGNLKKIKDIKEGEYIQTLNCSNSFEAKKVSKVFFNGEQQVYKISTLHGRV